MTERRTNRGSENIQRPKLASGKKAIPSVQNYGLKFLFWFLTKHNQTIACSSYKHVEISNVWTIWKCIRRNSGHDVFLSPNNSEVNTEWPLTNRLSYLGSRLKLDLDNPPLWSASIQLTRLHALSPLPRPPLVKIMAHGPCGAKPLLDSLMTYRGCDPYEQFNGIQIKIQTFALWKMYLKMSTPWRQSCSSLNARVASILPVEKN